MKITENKNLFLITKKSIFDEQLLLKDVDYDTCFDKIFKILKFKKFVHPIKENLEMKYIQFCEKYKETDDVFLDFITNEDNFDKKRLMSTLYSQDSKFIFKKGDDQFEYGDSWVICDDIKYQIFDWETMEACELLHLI